MRFSQFLYRVTPLDASNSQLDFTGFQIEYDDKKKRSADSISDELRKEDSHAWELLAKEMEKDMSRARKQKQFSFRGRKKEKKGKIFQLAHLRL
jgi:hypothetical protein